MANQPSDSEKQYYETLVAETAKETINAAEGAKKESSQAVIRRILEREDIFEEQRDRFRHDVLKKADELKAKAKDEREKRIVLKYEGEVRREEGKVRLAGIQEKFKFRVRTGNIYRRIVGHGVDADRMDELMQEVQDIEDRMERNKVELAQLKAARDATSTLIGTEKYGLGFRVTKAGLVRQIYAAKRNAQGWGSFFNSEANLYNSYKAAADLKDRHEEEYKTGGKAKIKQLEKEAKELGTKKKVLEAALKRVEQLRSDGRAIFEATFGNELNILLEGRETLGEAEFVKRIGELRKKAEQFGKDAGFVGMDFFLKESLEKRDIKLAPGEYAKPQTRVEAARGRVRVARWWKEVFLADASEDDISAVLEGLQKADPDFLMSLTEGKIRNEKQFNMIMRFLFTGECPQGRTLLLQGRRAELNPENVVKYVKVAREAAQKTGGEENTKKILENFANTSRYAANDFEWSYDAVRAGKGIRESGIERLDHLAPVWQKLTGSRLENPNDANQVYLMIINRFGDKMGADVFVDSLDRLSREKQAFMRFFFTGKFEAEELIVSKRDFLLKPQNPSHFFKVYDSAHELLRRDPTRDNLRKVCRRLADVNFEDIEKDSLKERLLKEYEDIATKKSRKDKQAA